MDHLPGFEEGSRLVAGDLRDLGYHVAVSVSAVYLWSYLSELVSSPSGLLATLFVGAVIVPKLGGRAKLFATRVCATASFFYALSAVSSLL